MPSEPDEFEEIIAYAYTSIEVGELSLKAMMFEDWKAAMEGRDDD